MFHLSAATVVIASELSGFSLPMVIQSYRRDYTIRNSHGERVNGVLRMMVSTSQWKDFHAGPFMEDFLAREYYSNFTILLSVSENSCRLRIKI
jgi:hypothetical protein